MLGGAGRYPPLSRSLGANHNSTITCYEPRSPNGETEAGVPTAESGLVLRLAETMVRVFRRGKGRGRGEGALGPKPKVSGERVWKGGSLLCQS